MADKMKDRIKPILFRYGFEADKVEWLSEAIAAALRDPVKECAKCVDASVPDRYIGKWVDYSGDIWKVVGKNYCGDWSLERFEHREDGRYQIGASCNFETHPERQIIVDDNWMSGEIARLRRLEAGASVKLLPPVMEPASEPTAAHHTDSVCGSCSGPLEVTRDAICETCAPDPQSEPTAIDSATDELRKENERLRDALKAVVATELIKGLYHGGETYYGLNNRIRGIAREALGKTK